MAELERRVRAMDGSGLAEREAVERRQQVGSGMRGDKIRTYRLQDDIVTDNRSGKQGRWRKIERGDFSEVL